MISYKNGDLLSSDCDVICHQVNCKGVMGAGIAKQIRSKYPGVFNEYKNTINKFGKNKCFGEVLFFFSENGKIVANMFSQFDCYPIGVLHTDYDAFRSCCQKIRTFLVNNNLTRSKIGFPYKIGCGLAGGDWKTISEIIDNVFNEPFWNIEIWKI